MQSQTTRALQMSAMATKTLRINSQYHVVLSPYMVGLRNYLITVCNEPVLPPPRRGTYDIID